MTNQELNDLKNRFVANGAATPTTQFAERAENAELWDADGKRWIDFAGGIGVLNLGHRHPKIVAAVEAQLKKVMHTSAAVTSRRSSSPKRSLETFVNGTPYFSHRRKLGDGGFRSL